MRSRFIEDRIYRNTFGFFLHCADNDETSILRKIKQRFPKVAASIVAGNDRDFLKGKGGCCFLYPDDGFIAIITVKRNCFESDVATLAHECLHATMSLLNSRDVEYGTDTYSFNEAYTYLHEFLVFEGVSILEQNRRDRRPRRSK